MNEELLDKYMSKECIMEKNIINDEVGEDDLCDDDLYEAFKEEVQRDVGKMFDDLQACYREAGFPINTVHRIGMQSFFDSLFTHDGLSVECVIHMSPIMQKIKVMMRFMTVPLERVGVVLNYLNEINTDLYGHHLAIVPDTGQIALLAGMDIGVLALDKVIFKALLAALLDDMRRHAPIIKNLVASEPQS